MNWVYLAEVWNEKALDSAWAFAAVHPMLAVEAGLVPGILLAWFLWWRLPRLEARRFSLGLDPKGRADIEDNFRKTITQLIGGAAVLVGAWFAYQGTQRTIKAGDEQSRRSVISDQITKGFDLLGEEHNLVKRLGGIYALQGVMNSSDDYLQPVLDALCAFVREKTKDVTSDSRPAADIQAALTVIAHRPKGHGTINLAGAHIPKASLEEADLRGANLNMIDLHDAFLGGANLQFAMLADANLSRVHLEGANLTEVDLSGADLSDADLRFSQLSGATLLGSRMSANERAIVVNAAPARIRGTDLTGADLSTDVAVDQWQLDEACGIDVFLPPHLKIHPCR